MARTYNRDSRGRFTSGGGSGGGGGSAPKSRGNTGPRGGKSGTRSEQARAKKAQQQRTKQFQGKTTAGRESRSAWRSAASAARAARRKAVGGAKSSIKRTGGLPRPVVGNSIKQTNRNAGLNTDRQVKDAWRQMRRQQVSSARSMARMQARAIADRRKRGVAGEIARATIESLGTGLGNQQIKRRARRAAQLAAGGSRAAARALDIYNQQLGKPRARAGALAKREPAGALVPTRKATRVNTTPAPARQPKIADALRSTLRELAQSDARFYRDLEQIVGPIKVPKPKPARTTGNATSVGNQRGSVSGALRTTLRDLARADAARLREIQDITKPSASGAISGSKGSKRKGVSGSGSSRSLPGGKPRGGGSKPKRKR